MDVNMATAEALERETKKARKEEHEQSKVLRGFIGQQ